MFLKIHPRGPAQANGSLQVCKKWSLLGVVLLTLLRTWRDKDVGMDCRISRDIKHQSEFCKVLLVTKTYSKWSSEKTRKNGPKWPLWYLIWAYFQFFGDFWAKKPSSFFQMGEISASVRHETRSDRGRNVLPTKMAKKYQIWPFWCILWPFSMFFRILSHKIRISQNIKHQSGFRKVLLVTKTCV